MKPELNAEGEIVASSNCPNCGKHSDRLGGMTDDVKLPDPGDLTVCAYCYDIQKFESDGDGGLTLRSLRAAELIRLPEKLAMLVSRGSLAVERLWKEKSPQ